MLIFSYVVILRCEKLGKYVLHSDWRKEYCEPWSLFVVLPILQFSRVSQPWISHASSSVDGWILISLHPLLYGGWNYRTSLVRMKYPCIGILRFRQFALRTVQWPDMRWLRFQVYRNMTGDPQQLVGCQVKKQQQFEENERKNKAPWNFPINIEIERRGKIDR